MIKCGFFGSRPGRAAPLAVVASAFLLAAPAGCGTQESRPGSPLPPAQAPSQPFEKLSQYALFLGEPAAQQPASAIIPYDLNSALFSDYAEKLRFIRLPPGTHATYRDDDTFDFPVGTVIAKTFAFPRDARAPSQGAG